MRNHYFVRVLISCIFFLVLGLYIFWKFFFIYFPRSEISIRGFCKERKKITTTRRFNVLGDEEKGEIDEIFGCSYINWDENDCYYSDVSFFEGFNCYYYKSFPNEKIKANTLIYFPSNNVSPLDEVYLVDVVDKSVYYPESNSTLLVERDLKWVGRRNLRVVLGFKE